MRLSISPMTLVIAAGVSASSAAAFDMLPCCTTARKVCRSLSLSPRAMRSLRCIGALFRAQRQQPNARSDRIN